MTKSGLNDVITDEAEGEGRTDIRILREKKRSPSYQYEKRFFGKVNTGYAGFFGAGGAVRCCFGLWDEVCQGQVFVA